MKVVLAETAKKHAAEIDEWWRENRPSAPDLFADELIAARSLIGDAPHIGTRFPARGRVVRRVRLRKTKHHVYYVTDEVRGVVLVVAVWGMPKAKTPKL